MSLHLTPFWGLFFRVFFEKSEKISYNSKNGLDDYVDNRVGDKEILKHKITSEDKRIGKYFVSKDCLTEVVCNITEVKVEAEKFAYKVLEYIWNDVCKISKDDWFDTSALLTLEDLIDAFVNPKEEESPLAVFKTISFK